VDLVKARLTDSKLLIEKLNSSVSDLNSEVDGFKSQILTIAGSNFY